MPAIYPSFIGFGAGIPIAIVFVMLHKGQYELSKLLGFGFAIYIAGVFTGYGFYSADLTEDMQDSYYIAGICAPLIYMLLVSIWIRIQKKKKEKTDIDHLIGGY